MWYAIIIFHSLWFKKVHERSLYYAIITFYSLGPGAEPPWGLGGPRPPQAPRFSPKNVKKIKILPQILLFFSNFGPPKTFFFNLAPPTLGGWLRPCLGRFSVHHFDGIC
jgi:hypothetical protein